MRNNPDQPWLHRFALLTAVSTLVLIAVGGVVTSKGVGLAVPDWPTTYGYNMFLFPWSKMVGGIFYEHSHRLVASAVGLLTTVLAVWLWLKEPRLWVRVLGVAAWLTVVAQGVLGGLRVVWLKDELGIVHACLAQGFFVMTVCLALFTSRWWKKLPSRAIPDGGGIDIRWLLGAVTAMIFVQLVLGATMRHEHAGLAITDFPLSYGRVLPPLDPVSIAQINRERVQLMDLPATDSFQILLHWTHRAWAVLILGAVVFAAARVKRTLKAIPGLAAWGYAWVALVIGQMILGAATVWTNKAADVATAHVALGALILAVGMLLSFCAARCVRRLQRAGEPLNQWAAEGGAL